MEIYLTSPPLQLLAVILILFSTILSYFRPRFIVLLIPIVLPLYLVKIYFRPQAIFNFQSYFSPEFSQTPVIRPDLGSHNLIFPTNLLEILLIFFLLLNIPLIIRGFKLVYQKYPGKYFLISLFTLIMAVITSTIYAINLRVALGAAKSWFFLPILLFFALLPLLKDREFRQKLLYSFVISGAVIIFMNVLYFFENTFTYDGRLSGIFLSPNHLAMALIPGILASIMLIKEQGLFSSESFKLLPNVHYKYHLSLAGLLLLELYFLYKTYSYGAWLALVAAFLLIAVGVKNLANKWPYYLIALAYLVFAGVSQLGNPKLQHLVNGDYYSSLHSRLMIWDSALLISRDHWLAGIGADNFQQAYLDYQKRFTEPYLEWSAPQPHNVFLAFQTQLGTLGLLAFISLLILTFKSSYGVKKDPLTLWALAYLAYFVFHGLVDTPYMKNDLAILFWLALAACWTGKSTRITDYASPSK